MHKARKERQMAMEAAKKQAKKPPKTSASANPTSSRAQTIYSSSRMDGMGLWVQPGRSETASQLQVTETSSQLTQDLDQKVASEINSILEKKCSKFAMLS